MGQARQTLERRQLGLTLRRLRVKAALPQQVAADAIGKVRSRVVALEDGTATATQEDLTRLLDCYGVTGDERETVFALGAQARTRQRKRIHTDLLPGSFQRFADLEANACTVSSFEQSIVPGVLQSPDYVRAALGEWDDVWPASSAAESEERMSFRLARQARTLGVEGPKGLHIVVAEDALRAVVGSPDVMREQLLHILRLVQERPGLVVQVLPRTATVNPARGGGLTLFDFGDRADPIGYSSVIYGPSLYFDEEPDTTVLTRLFAAASQRALAPEQSRTLTETILREI
ncbi:helix-turn-helix domain-containing protein [Solihabitans fulvus]|nr:helix-turn-helix transcriptional regulator [Solihabitans fulvus]